MRRSCFVPRACSHGDGQDCAALSLPAPAACGFQSHMCAGVATLQNCSQSRCHPPAALVDHTPRAPQVQHELHEPQGRLQHPWPCGTHCENAQVHLLHIPTCRSAALLWRKMWMAMRQNIRAGVQLFAPSRKFEPIHQRPPPAPGAWPLLPSAVHISQHELVRHYAICLLAIQLLSVAAAPHLKLRLDCSAHHAHGFAPLPTASAASGASRAKLLFAPHRPERALLLYL
mmetsp:Transcript_81769/g.154426  ORF Transcript_81769/g.154426 Transcript_81769/m.154426 type:complete len:229 (-) Transcript_81769:1048-1734(-)